MHKTKQTAASVREKGTADAVQIMSSTAWQRAAFEQGSHREQLKAGHSQQTLLGHLWVKQTMFYIRSACLNTSLSLLERVFFTSTMRRQTDGVSDEDTAFSRQ